MLFVRPGRGHGGRNRVNIHRVIRLLRTNYLRIQEDSLLWAAGNGDPMHTRCVYLTQDTSRMGHSKGEVRSRHKNNSERGVRNMEGRNLGTKRKVPNKA